MNTAAFVLILFAHVGPMGDGKITVSETFADIRSRLGVI